MPEAWNLLFHDLIKYLIICPIFGFACTVIIFPIIESIKKKKKRKCWLYFSIASFALGSFIKAFL